MKHSWVFFLLLSLVGVYTVALIISPHLGPTDDFLFLRTLQAGRFMSYYSSSFPYYDTIRLGHFQPLGSMEYNLIALLSRTPFAYFLIHALQLIAFFFLFRILLRKVTTDNRIINATSLLLMLLPGFTFAWFKLQMNERNELLFVTFFLLTLFYYFEKRGRWTTLLAVLLMANAVIHYKEIGFVLAGGFAFFHLLFSLWNTKFRLPAYLWRLDLLIGLSAAIYLILYAVFILPYGGVFVYGTSGLSWFELMAKLFLNYGFVSDPFIILLIIPLAISRCMRIVRHTSMPDPFYDSALFTSVLYVGVFFFLKLSGVHYFLPAYPMAIIALIHFWPEYKHLLRWKMAAGVVAVILIIESIPFALHTATYNIYQSTNFEKTISFLANDIKKTNSHPTIFFSGLPAGGQNWYYFIISEFMQSKGLIPSQFDLSAETRDVIVSSAQPLPIPIPKIPLPYTVFTDNPLAIQHTGDYLVVSPLSTDSIKNSDNADYLKNLESSYRLIFKTTSPLEIPLFTAKELGRYILSLRAKPGDRFLSISRKPPRAESPDFYVFIKN